MKQSEIWLINLDPSIGAEIKKTRPAIIINDNHLGKLPLKIIVPLTDWKDRYSVAVWMVKIIPDSKTNCLNYLQQTVSKFGLYQKTDLSKGLVLLRPNS